MNKDFIYYGLFLEGDNLRKVQRFLQRNNILKKIKEPKTVYLEHCTLLHCSQDNNKLKELLDSMLELDIPIGINSIGYSDKAVAFGVKLPKINGESICNNMHPHITIATLNGGKPVDSNNIVNWELLEHPIYIEGKLKVK